MKMAYQAKQWRESRLKWQLSPAGSALVSWLGALRRVSLREI